MPTTHSYSQALGASGWNPVKRAKPRLVVRRGYAGNETSALSRSLAPWDGESIYSGQLVTEDIQDGVSKFKLAGGALAAGKTYIAYHDSSDPDVISGGKLLAFDLNGDFEFESAYFEQDDQTPADGDDIVAASDGSGKSGWLTINGSSIDGGGVVLGYLRGVSVDLSDGQYSSTVDNMAQDTQASAANSVVIRWVTV